jgi:hypothetical protein
MNIIICPGIHKLELTRGFLEGLQWRRNGHLSGDGKIGNVWVFPTQEYPAYSAVCILQFLEECIVKNLSDRSTELPVIFISFSAGVVGAIGAAWGWQLLGRQVKAFIAVDGWGVPLIGNFPIHRLSHDYFTHWSSALLGSGNDSFYADPSVDHLQLWHQPQNVRGCWVRAPGTEKQFSSAAGEKSLTTAAKFITHLLQIYGYRI